MPGVEDLLLWGMAALFIGFTGALVMPVSLGFAARTQPRWQVRLFARLYGGLTPPLQIFDWPRPRKSFRSPAERSSRRRKKSTSHGRRVGRALISAPGLLIGLLRPFRLERLAISADVGLSDPADTGQLVGMLAPLMYGSPGPDTVEISVRPDFSEPRLDADLALDVRFVPIALLPPIVALARHVLRA